MPQSITVPGEGVIEFPDGMSDAQINAEIVKAFPHLGGAKEQAMAYGKAPMMGSAETATEFATGMLAAPVAGLAGIGQGVYNVVAPAFGGQPGRPAAQRVEEVQQGLTYQPTTEAGKVASQTIGYPFVKLGEAANVVGEKVAQASGSPLLGALTRAAPDVALAMASPEARGAARSVGSSLTRGAIPASATAAPAAAASIPAAQMQAAEQWATSAGLSWGKLPAETQQALGAVAADATKLQNLSPLQVTREANLVKFGLTPTKGMVTRDPLQLRSEQLAKAGDTGNVLRQIDLDNNARLAESLQKLRTAGEAKEPTAVGKSVQQTLRDRLAGVKLQVNRLYKTAERAGELQGPAEIGGLVDYLNDHVDPTQVGYVAERLKRIGAIRQATAEEGGGFVSTGNPVSLAEIEAIRKAAVAKGKGGGTEGHYASEVKSVIDDLTEGAGGDAYKAARAARLKQGEEFERQGMVAKLVSNRGKSSDRAVALEDTWRSTVLNGSVEDLQKVKTSLFKSKGGVAAWDDLRNATIDYLYEKATGGPKNERGQVNVNWGGLKRARNSLETEKLESLIGKSGVRQLDSLIEAAEIAKTEPPTGVKGSPTLDKFVTLMDKLGAVPVAGKLADVVSGAAKTVGKLRSIGETSRKTKAAQVTPLQQAARQSLKPPVTLGDVLASGARKVGRGVYMGAQGLPPTLEPTSTLQQQQAQR